MGLWGWKRWKLERVGGLNINKEKMFTDSFCKHALINKILQAFKNRTVQSHKNLCYWSSHQTWSSSAMHDFTVIRICVSPSGECYQHSQNLVKMKKKVTILHLSLKTSYSALKAVKCGGNVRMWASNRPELKLSSRTS